MVSKVVGPSFHICMNLIGHLYMYVRIFECVLLNILVGTWVFFVALLKTSLLVRQVT